MLSTYVWPLAASWATAMTQLCGCCGSPRAASERSGPRSVRREARPTGPPLLVVVDDELLTDGRKAPTRSLLRGEGGPVAGIVVASTADRLPAVCTTVVEMTDPDGG